MRRILLCVVLTMSIAVIVGGVDLVAEGIVDEDTIQSSDNIRGFDRATFAAHGLPHIRAHNNLVRGAAVSIIDDGVTTFAGEINDVDITASPHEVTCDGLWEQCKRRTDFKYGCIETRYEAFEEIPVNVIEITEAPYQFTDFSLFTDGEMRVSIGAGTACLLTHTFYVGLKILDGYSAGAISRITFDYSTSLGTYWEARMRLQLDREQWNDQDANDEEVAAWADVENGSVDFSPSSVTNANRLYIWFGSYGNETPTSELYLQIRNLKIYVSRTSAPTIPAAIAEVATGTGLAASSSMEASGSALTAGMWDAETTRSEVIESLRSQLAAIYDVAFWESSTVYGTVRPTSPPLPTQHLALRSSDLASPDDWSVRIPAESRLDAVCGVYEFEPVNECDTPTPTSASWPGDWTRTSTNCSVYDAGSGDYYFRVQSAAGDWNPYCYHIVSGITVGRRYMMRAFISMNPWDSGTAQAYISWRNAGGTEISTTSLWSKTGGDAAAAWREVTGVAPAGATEAWLFLLWSGHASSGGASIFAKNVQFTDASPSGTLKRTYYPSEPSAADARVATYTLGRATDTEASNAITQAYLQNADVPDGQVALDGRILETVTGSPVNPRHIRSLSWWVSKVDAIEDEERGPFVVTSAERAGDGTVTLGFGSEAYSPPGFEHPSAKGRYIGGRVVKKRYRKRVSFVTYWHWRHRNWAENYKKKHGRYPYSPAAKKYIKEHGKVPGWNWNRLYDLYPQLPEKYPRYGYVWKYKDVEKEGYYL